MFRGQNMTASHTWSDVELPRFPSSTEVALVSSWSLGFIVSVRLSAGAEAITPVLAGASKSAEAHGGRH